jgi:hypothetical protein
MHDLGANLMVLAFAAVTSMLVSLVFGFWDDPRPQVEVHARTPGAPIIAR